MEVLAEDDRPIDVGGRQARIVLAVLLLADGRRTSADALVDALWPDDPPRSASGTVQTYVSRLRRALAPGGVELTLDDGGYRMIVPDADSSVDARRFDAMVGVGLDHLAAGRAAEAVAAIDEATALWRGPALADVVGTPTVRGPAARLEERRLVAQEARAEAALAVGRHAEVVADLTDLAAEEPLREHLHELRALALYRSGRQAEALRALADAGARLREDLGIEPGRALRELEAAILAQDPALDPGRPLTPSPPAAGTGAGAARVAAAADVHLVGRDAELGRLLASLDAAADSSVIVLLEGEAGVGKSRLAEELRSAAGARGSPTVWGRGDEGGAAPALWPWLTVLRELAVHVGDVGEPVARLLAGAPPAPRTTPSVERFGWFEAVSDLLTRAGADRPVVVVIDDLHWADATSLELLAHLASGLRGGVLLVATLREPEVGRDDDLTATLAAIARRPGSLRLRLGGLDGTGTAELVRGVLGTTADTAAIHARAEGNPFYALELARMLAEGDGDPADDLPATVRDVVARRLGRLPEETGDVLALAAVIGRDVDPGLVARAAGVAIGPALDALEPAVVHRLLVEVPGRPDVLRFGHGLVRDVVVDRLTVLRRARLHLAVADAMEAAGMVVDDAEVVADHLWRAVPLGVGRRAAEALEHAAIVASRRGSDPVADDLLTKALHLRRRAARSDADDEAELATIRRLLDLRRVSDGAADAETTRLTARAGELAGRLTARRGGSAPH